MVSRKELMDQAKIVKKNCSCNKGISKYNKTQLEKYIKENKQKQKKNKGAFDKVKFVNKDSKEKYERFKNRNKK